MKRPDTTSLEHYRVVRRSGLLVPGFTKRIDAHPHERSGATCFLGVHVGAFDVRPASEFGHDDDAERCLRYRLWPVVDVLERRPSTVGGGIPAAGYLRLPGGRRVRFCTFLLEPRDD